MYPRFIEKKLHEMAQKYPVVVLTGPRQAGKSTLLRGAFPDLDYVNLEASKNIEFATNDPAGFLAQFSRGVILDEVQKAPNLMGDIQVIVDEAKVPGRFILSGSENLMLSQSISQSLAGRVMILKLLPLTLEEALPFPLQVQNVEQAIYCGFYPRIFNDELNPTEAYGAYVETYLERDVRNLLQVRELAKFRRFIELCAGRTGQLLNKDSLANDAGVSPSTIEQWLSILEATFVCFRLQPWHANIGKRLIKSPKLYFYDVGLASYLLGIGAPKQILSHPLRGSLFETMQVVEVRKFLWNRNLSHRLYFYRDSNGNEVDLLLQVADSHLPVEIKSARTFDPSFNAGLVHFQALGVKTMRPIVVLGADSDQARSEFDIVSWRNLANTVAERLGLTVDM